MKKILKNYLYNVSYHIFAILIPLITTPYLSRILGAAEIGSYAYEFSASSYFSLFTMLGVKNYGSKIIASSKDDTKSVAENFWNIYTMQAVMLVIVSLFYVVYVLMLSRNNRLAAILYLIVLSGGIDITWFFWGIEDFKTTVFRDFIVKTFTTIFIFLLVKTTDDTWKYALIISVGTFFSQVILWKELQHRIPFIMPQLSHVIKHVRTNIVMFIPIVAVNVYKTMDKIMLGIMASSKEVGYYYSSEKIICVPMAIITSLNTVMLPRISASKNRRDNIKVIEQSMRFSICITVMISVSIMSVANEFVPVFYGEGFEKCIGLFYLLLPNCILIAFTNVICYQFLIPNDYANVYAGARVVGAMVNLIMNYALIPLYNSYGAAVGTIFTEITVCTVQNICIRGKIRQCRMLIESSISILVGIFVFGLFLNFHFDIVGRVGAIIVKATLSAFTYAVIVMLLGAVIIKNDKEKSLI